MFCIRIFSDVFYTREHVVCTLPRGHARPDYSLELFRKSRISFSLMSSFKRNFSFFDAQFPSSCKSSCVAWTLSECLNLVVQKSSRIFMYVCTNTNVHGLILSEIFFDRSIRPKALSAPGHYWAKSSYPTQRPGCGVIVCSCPSHAETKQMCSKVWHIKKLCWTCVLAV